MRNGVAAPKPGTITEFQADEIIMGYLTYIYQLFDSLYLIIHRYQHFHYLTLTPNTQS
jgi:hypothetical protein